MILNLNYLLLAATVATGGPGGGDVRVERRAYLMGTLLRAEVVAADRETAMHAVEAAFAEVRRLEEVLSSWNPASEISALNAAEAGIPTPISAELARVLSEVVEWRNRTGGAFDPGIGPLVDAWDLRGDGRKPMPEEIRQALSVSGIDRFTLDASGPAVVKGSGAAWLDTGGFGKGLALREAARVLREAGVHGGVLDFGGQVLVVGGADEGGGSGRIAIADPTDRDRAIGWVGVAAGSVATSGQSERFVEVGAGRYGHILDPRSGTPVPAWGSVTVVADDPLAADVLSTALYVMGPAEGRRWAAALEGVGVLFLEEDEMGVAASWNGAFEKFDFHLETEAGEQIR